MKLSQIEGERCFEVIADLVDPISSIANDPDVQKLFKREKVPKGKDARTLFVEKVTKGVPVLLRAHKDDVVAVMATINGVTREEYLDGLNLAKLLQDVVEVFTDEEIVAFLA